MNDQTIIDLCFARSQDAIAALSAQYGTLCSQIARNILQNASDAQECVNDTYLAVWNSIPPQRPDPLTPYVCRITRNIAVSRLRERTARRRDSRYDASLDELAECIAAPETVESAFDAQELARAINTFLQMQETADRVLFLRRYWFGDSVSDAAKRVGLSSAGAAVRLYRLRRHLRDRLTEGGYL